jgi:hypothetical protein
VIDRTGSPARKGIAPLLPGTDDWIASTKASAFSSGIIDTDGSL